jgi:GntR family transcriptional repressor for pyruvate dehydrogenase complex
MSGKAETVKDYIEKKIILGEYAPGEKIPSEAKLCKELHVSRISVRSGIEQLIAIGLLNKQKYGGTYVALQNEENYLKVLTPALMHNFDYLEMLELRQALDALSIELCITNINDEIIKELKKLLKEMQEYKNVQSSFFLLDRKFHLTISKYSFNRLLHNINELIWEVLENNAKEQYHKIGNEERVIEHSKILDAIINRDRELARIYSIRHLSRTIKDIKNGG